jgi:hypothetical protein
MSRVKVILAAFVLVLGAGVPIDLDDPIVYPPIVHSGDDPNGDCLGCV